MTVLGAQFIQLRQKLLSFAMVRYFFLNEHNLSLN